MGTTSFIIIGGGDEDDAQVRIPHSKEDSPNVPFMLYGSNNEIDKPAAYLEWRDGQWHIDVDTSLPSTEILCRLMPSMFVSDDLVKAVSWSLKSHGRLFINPSARSRIMHLRLDLSKIADSITQPVGESVMPSENIKTRLRRFLEMSNGAKLWGWKQRKNPKAKPPVGPGEEDMTMEGTVLDRLRTAMAEGGIFQRIKFAKASKRAQAASTDPNATNESGNMKIKPEHYTAIVKGLAATKAAFPKLDLQYYKDNKIGKNHAVRWRWDMYNASKINGVGSAKWSSDNLYSYLDDHHIDTALKRAVKEVWGVNEASLKPRDPYRCDAAVGSKVTTTSGHSGVVKQIKDGRHNGRIVVKCQDGVTRRFHDKDVKLSEATKTVHTQHGYVFHTRFLPSKNKTGANYTVLGGKYHSHHDTFASAVKHHETIRKEHPGSHIVNNRNGKAYKHKSQPANHSYGYDESVKEATGPRGGKIIGKTRSGKPIYANTYRHPSYSDWTDCDHGDARDAHMKASKTAKTQMKASDHRGFAYAHDDERAMLSTGRVSSSYSGGKPRVKEATGPKGGKIIGKTSSGKPVYAPHRALIFGKTPEERNKAASTHLSRHTGFTSKDHEDAAEIHRKESDRYHGKKESGNTVFGKVAMAHGVAAYHHKKQAGGLNHESVTEGSLKRGDKVRVTIKKVDGEWQAQVYVNGKYSEGLTYFSGADDGDGKEDVTATAADMRKRFEKQGCVVEGVNESDVLGLVRNTYAGVVADPVSNSIPKAPVGPDGNATSDCCWLSVPVPDNDLEEIKLGWKAHGGEVSFPVSNGGPGVTSVSVKFPNPESLKGFALWYNQQGYKDGRRKLWILSEKAASLAAKVTSLFEEAK